MREYAKLPEVAKKFIENIEAETGLKVTLIGTGKEIYDIIDRRTSS
jgi:adenylosuccinate synthase